MIEEEGIVIELTQSGVVIRARRRPACESCSTKSMCRPDSNEEMLIEADNPVGAGIGDDVLFSIQPSTMLKAGALVYLLPLLSFIAGVVAGQVAGPRLAPEFDKDLLSTIAGFAFVGLAFIFIRLYGRRTEGARAFRPTVTKVLARHGGA